MFEIFSADYTFVIVAMSKIHSFIFIDISGHFMQESGQLVITK